MDAKDVSDIIIEYARSHEPFEIVAARRFLDAYAQDDAVLLSRLLGRAIVDGGDPADS